MTLHEQYKEDTEPHPFLKNKGHVKILMKKAYLNSIDCMIAILSEQRDLIANEL